MDRAQTYAKLAEQAEKAVAAVKDAELRRVAFERILNDLLAREADDFSAQQSSPPSKAKSRPRAPAPEASRAPRSTTRGGPMGYVEELLSDGFFKKQKTISEVKAELGNRGHHIPLTSLSGPLQKLCQKKRLRRQKLDGTGGKKTFGYSEW
jgi:hypothetical protein